MHPFAIFLGLKRLRVFRLPSSDFRPLSCVLCL
jgi:hypothetical protein